MIVILIEAKKKLEREGRKKSKKIKKNELHHELMSKSEQKNAECKTQKRENA